MYSNGMNKSESHKSAIQKSKEKISALLGADGPNGHVMVTPANWLTMFRLVVVPFFWFTFYSGTPSLGIVATALFVFGALSDLFDGKLARKHQQVTPFGDFMDPLADKLLVLSAFWAIFLREDFGAYTLTAVVWIGLVTLRETLVTFLRIYAIEGGSSLVTSSWGKWKTGIHLTTIILTLLLFNLRDFLLQSNINPGLLTQDVFYLFLNILLFLCMIPSVMSGILYFSGGKRKSL